MNRWIQATLLVVLALVLLPALCMGGVLDHACACDSDGCGHESDCGDDPCETLLKSDKIGCAAEDLIALLPSSRLGCPRLQPMAFSATAWAPAPPPPRLPCHPSDVPLLI